MLATRRESFNSILSTIVRLNTPVHIVCLDAPSPADYGGAIDMHYKIKALAEVGTKIFLHYFSYNPSRDAKGLESYCEAVFTYKRKSIFKALPLAQPFIVQSRISNELIERLNKDVYPVLLEGLHCTGIIPFLNNEKRIIVRMHNEEASYYHHLAKTETSFIKRKYFLQESTLLKRYQQSLSKDLKLACLSETDIEIFRKDYGLENAHFIPCFIPWQQLASKEGLGNYCLYHGNMLVSENEEAALWLIRNVFSTLNFSFVIAGKGISKKLYVEAARHSNVTLINNPPMAKMDDLIDNAQVNVLPSMNSTGVKLKLLNALINGRHCITNYNGIKGSKIKEGVVVVDAAEQWIEAINQLMQRPFKLNEIEKRKSILDLYNNQTAAKDLIALYSHYQ